MHIGHLYRTMEQRLRERLDEYIDETYGIINSPQDLIIEVGTGVRGANRNSSAKVQGSDICSCIINVSYEQFGALVSSSTIRVGGSICSQIVEHDFVSDGNTTDIIDAVCL